MQSDDFDNFVRVLDAAYSIHSKPLTADARSLFFAALGEFSLADVRRAFSSHMKDPVRGRYAPTPADVIAQMAGMNEKDGRPGVEEAWAIAKPALDERITVVWTCETADAFGIARDLLAAGDEIGARMAFKEAYARLVGIARAQRAPVAWRTTLGWDPEIRTSALTEAVRLLRVPEDSVRHLLPTTSTPLLEGSGAQRESVCEEGLARLRALIDTLPSQQQLLERAAAARVEAEARRLREMKDQAAKLVADHQGDEA